MATPSPIPNMPGWVRVYKAGHGFNNRHYYDPNSGASLSQRAGDSVRDGKTRLDQQLLLAAHPRRIFMTKVGGVQYRVSVFNTIYGAVRYARTRSTRAMYISAYGEPTQKYKGETEQMAYRALSTLQDKDLFQGKQALEQAYAKFNNYFNEAARTPTYTLMERIER